MLCSVQCISIQPQAVPPADAPLDAAGLSEGCFQHPGSGVLCDAENCVFPIESIRVLIAQSNVLRMISLGLKKRETSKYQEVFGV